MDDDHGLRRALGPWDAIAVVVGAIVGVGIFFTPSRVAALTGSDALFLATWGIGGVIALLGAMTFAELGGLYPRTGGQYVILRDAFGPAVGFLQVVCSTTAVLAGAIGIIAIVCVHNIAVLLSGHPLEGWPVVAAAAGLTVVIAVINAGGVRRGAWLQNVTVVAKLVALLVVVAVAIAVEPSTASTSAASVSSPAAATSPSPWMALAGGLVAALFSFGGGQVVLWLGGEIRDPQRNVPRAILIGVVIVVTIYLGANWAYLHLLGIEGMAHSQALAADAMSVAVGDVGQRVVAAMVGVSALGVLNAQLLGGPRLLLALARDGRFFRPFAQVHARWGTPVPALMLVTAIALGLLFAAGADGIDRLLTGVVLIDTVFFALTGLASVVLARRHPHAQRPIRLPGFPVVPLLFVLAEVGVAIGAWTDPAVRDAAVIGVGWIVAALLLYLVRFRHPKP